MNRSSRVFRSLREQSHCASPGLRTELLAVRDANVWKASEVPIAEQNSWLRAWSAQARGLAPCGPPGVVRALPCRLAACYLWMKHLGGFGMAQADQAGDRAGSATAALAAPAAAHRGVDRVPGRARRTCPFSPAIWMRCRAPGLGGAIIIATIILQPIAAAAALFFLVRGNLPGRWSRWPSSSCLAGSATCRRSSCTGSICERRRQPAAWSPSSLRHPAADPGAGHRRAGADEQAADAGDAAGRSADPDRLLRRSPSGSAWRSTASSGPKRARPTGRSRRRW